MIRQTSIDAYNEIKKNGLLGKRQWQVYEIVSEHGPLTMNQMFRKIDEQTNHCNPMNHGSFGTRLSELRNLGVIEEFKEDTCPITGRKVIFWDVTDKLPKKLIKKQTTKKEKTMGIEKNIERIATALDTIALKLAPLSVDAELAEVQPAEEPVKKKAAKAETKPAKTTKAKIKKVSIDEVREKLKQYALATTSEKAVAILDIFKAKKVSDLNEAQRVDLVTAISQAV